MLHGQSFLIMNSEVRSSNFRVMGISPVDITYYCQPKGTFI